MLPFATSIVRVTSGTGSGVGVDGGDEDEEDVDGEDVDGAGVTTGGVTGGSVTFTGIGLLSSFFTSLPNNVFKSFTTITGFLDVSSLKPWRSLIMIVFLSSDSS
ncbi:hypothetical protein D3C76_1175500 [compost metagenome]